MVENFLNLSQYYENHLTTNDKINILRKKVNTQSYKYTIVIFFDVDNVEYQKVDLEETKEDGLKYLLTDGPSNGINYSPTALVNDYKKTFENKILKYFKSEESKEKKLLKSKLNLFNKIYNELEKNQEKIKTKIDNLINEISKNKESSKNTKYLITIGFINKNNEKEIRYYLSDIIQEEIIQQLKTSKYYEDFVKIKEIIVSKFQESISDIKSDGVCYGCNKNTEVLAKGFPLTFYTFDKTNYIANGFKRNEMYKNFPLCLECIYKIVDGYNFIENNLKFKISKHSYYIIPEFVLLDKNHYEFTNLFKDYIEKFYKEKEKIDKLTVKLTEDRNEILDYICNKIQNPNITYLLNFLFFEKSQNAFRIKFYIENVLPGTISKILKAKEKIDLIFDSKDFVNKFDKNHKEILTKEFKLDDIEKNTLNSDEKVFFEIIGNILKLTLIDKKIIFKYITETLSKKSKSDFSSDFKSIFENVIYNFKFYLLLLELDLIESEKGVGIKNYEKEVNQMNIEKIENRNILIIEEFFNKFERAFNNDLLKFAFLLGSLTQIFMSIQYKERKSTPFVKNIKNFKMNEQDFKNLFTELKNKLLEYDVHFKTHKILQELITFYYLKAGSNWKQNYKNTTLEEVNFYFALGMSFSEYIKKFIKENTNGNQSDDNQSDSNQGGEIDE